MFEVIEGRCSTRIRLTRGDTAVINTEPWNDVDHDDIYNPEDANEVIILGDNDYVLFTVASCSGRKYIEKLLTKNDYNELGVLQLRLSPADTKDMQPFTYKFSFQYMQNNGEDCFTYSQGDFELLESINTVDALSEILTPEIPDEEPDGDEGANNDSENPENGADNTGGETDGDNG